MIEPNVGQLHLLTKSQDMRRMAKACVLHNEKFIQRQAAWKAEGPAAIDKALSYLLNGTIIVDSLAEAKKTSYQDARKLGLMPKVVTLDGEVISANGNMSVQSVSSRVTIEFGWRGHFSEWKHERSECELS